MEAYGMEVTTEKSKLVVNSKSNCTAEILIKEQKLKEVDKLKYLGQLSNDGSTSAEVCKGMDEVSATMASLDWVWKRNKISFPTRFRLNKSLVVSILMYCYETLTLLAVSEKRIQDFENNSSEDSYTSHTSNVKPISI